MDSWVTSSCYKKQKGKRLLEKDKSHDVTLFKKTTLQKTDPLSWELDESIRKGKSFMNWSVPSKSHQLSTRSHRESNFNMRCTGDNDKSEQSVSGIHCSLCDISSWGPGYSQHLCLHTCIFFQFIIYSYPTGKQKIHECQNFGFFPLTSKDLQLVLANKFN